MPAILVTMTEREREQVREWAWRARMSQAEWIRQAIRSAGAAQALPERPDVGPAAERERTEAALAEIVGLYATNRAHEALGAIERAEMRSGLQQEEIYRRLEQRLSIPVEILMIAEEIDALTPLSSESEVAITLDRVRGLASQLQRDWCLRRIATATGARLPDLRRMLNNLARARAAKTELARLAPAAADGHGGGA